MSPKIAMNEVLFDCDQCEGDVVLSVGPGRAREYRLGIVLDIPEDFPLATCQRCGETYITQDEAERLEPLLVAKLAEECRQLVETIQRETGYTQKQIELAAGVTPTYLSHVIAGRKQPSATLFGMLECLARHPEEATRRVERKHWKHTSPPVIAWTAELPTEQITPTVQAASSSENHCHLRLVLPTEMVAENVPSVASATTSDSEEATCLAG